MPTRGATLVVALVLALAGCTGGAPLPQRSATAAPGASSPTFAPSPPAPTAPNATPRATPAASPTPRPTVLPKPTGVTFHESTTCLLGEVPDTDVCRSPDDVDDPDGTTPSIEVTHTVTWRAPRTPGVEIRVYGVVECVSMPAGPKPGTSGPCLVENTRLPSSTLVLLATAPASAGKVSWSWRGWQDGEGGCDIWYPVGWAPDGRPYHAVVPAAYSASGPLSIFAIATAATWHNPADNDVYC